MDGKQLGIPVGSNTMSLVIDEKVFEKAGVKPKQGWTWTSTSPPSRNPTTPRSPATPATSASCICTTSTSGRTARRSSPRTDSASTRPSLTEWWTDGYDRVKAGIVADQAGRAGQAQVLALGGPRRLQFTWDNFTVRYTAEGTSTYGLAPIPTTDGKQTGRTSPP